MDELVKEEMRGRILAAGAIAVGFAEAQEVDASESGHYREWIAAGRHAEMEYLRRHIGLKTSLESVLPGAATVICVAFSYAPKKFRDSSLPQIACYAYGDDYHDVIRNRLSPVVEQFKTAFGGDWRICIDSAPVAERYWALKSGIGIRGKNGSVIVEGAGGYVFLAEIVTTVPIPADPASSGECKKCGACRKACPQNALFEDGTVDSRRCLNYLTIEHKGEWQGELKAAMLTPAAVTSLYGCDICLRVCPHNKKPIPTQIKEFEPREAVMRLTAEDVAQMTQEDFSRLFKGSPVKRAKLAGLQRNANNILSSKL